MRRRGAAPEETRARRARGETKANFMNITAFCCHNSLYGADGRGVFEKAAVPGVHKVELPCGSRLEPTHILKAFENGADGVAVVFPL